MLLKESNHFFQQFSMRDKLESCVGTCNIKARCHGTRTDQLGNAQLRPTKCLKVDRWTVGSRWNKQLFGKMVQKGSE
ncbi:hypothetical protein HanXRQr2_Chr10g0463041 [Helianthus annuus]|nr:hypothetical protein HanXRQr2_Chr10g0463041 [Helianthus annuus]KAJ0885584.1 hypothetical protein HanPSC8_Chr10g0446851 [Helianthus annuus]